MKNTNPIIDFDPKNPDHLNPTKYEVIEWETKSDGRHADFVEVGTMEEDAERRDFTVNALYYRLSDGEVVDPTGRGLEDIETRTLRFVGRAEERVREDFLRIFRWMRFVHKGFTPIKKEIRLVRTLFNEAYTNTNPERVREELEKMINL